MDSHFFSDFMPHGHCYFWRSDILWLSVISDSLIVLSYFSIPIAILILVKKHPELKVNNILILFALFIFGCGLTHATSIWNIWHGHYGLHAIILTFTAIVSVLTAVNVWRLMPTVLKFRSKSVYKFEEEKLLKLFNKKKQALEEEKNTLSTNNEQLVKELELRNEELNKAHEELIKTNENVQKHSEKLIQSNEELQQFAYIASHDLKAPLRNINGFLSLLSKKYDNQLDEIATEWIDRTLESTEKMQTLINDLLKFSRVETNGEVFKEHSLDNIIKDVLFSLESDIKDKDVMITKGDLPTLHVDRSQMIQLFSNLIANAIKYGQTESPQIHINAEEKTDTWEISIQDNGIGIDEAFHDKIFDIFTRLHSEKEYAGTGIGLAICKRVVQRHKGEIRVESAKGVGATFIICLPKNLDGLL